MAHANGCFPSRQPGFDARPDTVPDGNALAYTHARAHARPDTVPDGNALGNADAHTDTGAHAECCICAGNFS